jgi:hypothetical protein
VLIDGVSPDRLASASCACYRVRIAAGAARSAGGVAVDFSSWRLTC